MLPSGDEVRLTGKAPRREHGLPLVGRGNGAVHHELPDRPADELLARVAQKPDVRAVRVDVAALVVEQHHGIARLRERR